MRRLHGGRTRTVAESRVAGPFIAGDCQTRRARPNLHRCIKVPTPALSEVVPLMADDVERRHPARLM